MRGYTLTICVVLIGGMCICTAWQANAQMRLFGTHEVASAELSPFPKWMGMLERDSPQRRQMQEACLSNREGCLETRWAQMLDRARGLPFEETLASVNQGINTSAYVADMVNWGVEDYWETPIEFLLRSGDCEDYAIAKYMTLKRLGLPADAMRVVVVQDTNLRVLHSVLAVQQEAQTYILDNQIQQVVKDTSIHHYVPVYSINESGWWRHTP